MRMAQTSEDLSDPREDLSDPRVRRRSYTLVMVIYTGAVASLVWAGRRRGVRLREQLALRDLAIAALATQRLAMLLSHDPVTSPLRALFTEIEGVQGPAELRERARDDSKLRHTAGELLTCPFCLAQWIATAFVGGLVIAPRPTRLVISTFGIIGGADWLQRVHGRLASS